MKYVVQYIAVLVVFVAIDLVWLGVVAKRFYRDQLSGLIAENFHIGAATIFYLMYPAGVLLFAVAPSATWTDAILLGAALGLFAYGTYDLTNLATLRGWPVRLTVVDMVWGTVLTAVAAAAGHLLARMVSF